MEERTTARTFVVVPNASIVRVRELGQRRVLSGPFGRFSRVLRGSVAVERARDAQTVGVFPEYVFRERSVRLRRVWSVTRGETVAVLGRVHEEKRVEGESWDELVDEKKRVRVQRKRRNGEENDRNGNRRR